MPIAAQCPNCGGPLSETSVLALAPVCERCGTVITKIGGTFGLTSAYGVNDLTITRSIVAARLNVYCAYIRNYKGMMAACNEQLKWGVDRYAKLPSPPQLLPVVPVDTFLGTLLSGLGCGGAISIGMFIFGRGMWLASPELWIYQKCTGHDPMWLTKLSSVWSFLISVVWIGPPAYSLIQYCVAKVANGKRPLENAKRLQAHNAACAAARKAAELKKAAQDHRLRCQIRDLEGLIETVTEKAEDDRKTLRTL